MAVARQESGTVTAELVLGLPAVLMVIGLALGAMSLQLERMQLVSAASDLARAIAREEPMDEVNRLVAELGSEVSFEFSEDANLVCVILKSKVELLGIDVKGLELIETQCAKAQGR